MPNDFMTIDLRSDTVTRPTPQMLKAMFSAEVGDDVFGEDPTVNALEKKVADIFGKEAGLFCPSGTMTNQIAIRVHTRPGDEVICDSLSHIYNYEGGGIAANSGCSVKLLNGNRGRFTSEDVSNAVNPKDVHFPVTKLVAVENTCNKGGGSIWDIREIEKISRLCRRNNLKFHLDGARIFNAVMASGNVKKSNIKTMLKEMGSHFDSVSVCLSKGLGAPSGSVLLGDGKFIGYARRVRKVFGGGMRQAGYLAAAGIFALDNHIERLRDDHRRAKELESALINLSFIKNVIPVETNIVIFELPHNIPAEGLISRLLLKGIKVVPMGKQRIRMVTHLDFTDDMLSKVVAFLRKLK